MSKKKKIINRRIEFYECCIFQNGTQKLTHAASINTIKNMIQFHFKPEINKAKYNIIKRDGLDWIIELLEDNDKYFIFKIKSGHSVGNIEKTDISTFKDTPIELEKNDIIDQYTFLIIDKESFILGFMNYNSRGHHQILNRMLSNYNENFEMQFKFIPDKEIFENILRQKNIVFHYSKVREEALNQFEEIHELKDYLNVAGIDVVIKLKPKVGENVFIKNHIQTIKEKFLGMLDLKDESIKSIKGEALMNDETSKNIDLYDIFNPVTRTIVLEVNETEKVADVVRAELYEKFITLFEENLPAIKKMINTDY